MHRSPTENYPTKQGPHSLFSPSIKGSPVPFFCSWSGGKDSSLALYKAIQAGGIPHFLLTMMIETGNRSRSHGIPKEVLEAQSECMGIPIRFSSASWDCYTEQFIDALNFFKEIKLQKGVFGDIDIEGHREWVQSVCEKKDITPWMPLWQKDRIDLVKEVIAIGFQAEIIAVKEGVLSPKFLGKVLNAEVIEEFQILGIDLCGETGEYHTIVTDGPVFKQPLRIKHGAQVLKSGYWFSDVSLY